jgi:hypothetical protein
MYMPPLETIGEAAAVILAVGTGILGWLKSNSSKKVADTVKEQVDSIVKDKTDLELVKYQVHELKEGYCELTGSIKEFNNTIHNLQIVVATFNEALKRHNTFNDK